MALSERDIQKIDRAITRATSRIDSLSDQSRQMNIRNAIGILVLLKLKNIFRPFFYNENDLQVMLDLVSTRFQDLLAFYTRETGTVERGFVMSMNKLQEHYSVITKIFSNLNKPFELEDVEEGAPDENTELATSQN